MQVWAIIPVLCTCNVISKYMYMYFNMGSWVRVGGRGLGWGGVGPAPSNQGYDVATGQPLFFSQSRLPVGVPPDSAKCLLSDRPTPIVATDVAS